MRWPRVGPLHARFLVIIDILRMIGYFQTTPHTSPQQQHLVLHVQLSQHQLVLRERARLVRQDITDMTQRLAQGERVAVHLLVRGRALRIPTRNASLPRLQVLVLVDERCVDDLDQLQKHLQRRRHHARVKQQEPKRNDQVDEVQISFQVPARYVLVQRDADGREDHGEDDLMVISLLLRHLEDENDHGEDVADVIAGGDLVLGLALVLTELRLVSRVHGGAVSTHDARNEGLTRSACSGAV